MEKLPQKCLRKVVRVPEHRFHPYAFSGDALALQVESVVLDGDALELGLIYSPETLRVGLAERPIDRELRLGIVISDEADELAAVVQPHENPEDALSIAARLFIPSTRVRRLITCTRSIDGRWRGEVVIASTDIARRIELAPKAIRKADGSPSSGRASRRGEQVAGGELVVVELERSPPLPGNAMDAEWRDFGAVDSAEELRVRKDLSWFIDLSRPESPKLLLNSGIAGLRQALEAPAVSGPAAKVRDAIIASILQPVLALLGVEAIASSARVPAQHGEQDVLDGWRRDLLITLAHSCGDTTEELQLERWVAAWRAEKRTEVMVGLQTAVQRHLSLEASLRGLVLTVGGDPDA